MRPERGRYLHLADVIDPRLFEVGPHLTKSVRMLAQKLFLLQLAPMLLSFESPRGRAAPDGSAIAGATMRSAPPMLAGICAPTAAAAIASAKILRLFLDLFIDLHLLLALIAKEDCVESPERQSRVCSDCALAEMR